jgi:hypothetical protein
MRYKDMLLSASFAVLSATGMHAQPSPGPAAQMVVTVEPRHDGQLPPISQGDISVSSGKEHLTVLDWVPAANVPAQVFVLIDEGANTTIGTQFPALKRFFTDLPPGTLVGLGYMRNGTVDRVQDLTADHALAASKLRLPMASPGADASPYFSLQDLIKHWPAGNASDNGVRREVLMITDGVDRYYGRGPDNPYVDTAFAEAQKHGITVSSIYWSSLGHFGHSHYLINWGQNYLAQVAQETGGEAYWEGIGNPVSFEPYLNDFVKRLSGQYVLTFRPVPRNKPGLENVKVRIESKDLDLVAPQAVWVQ